MGKIRVRTIGDEEQEKAIEEERKRKKAEKKAQKQAEVSVEEVEMPSDTAEIKEEKEEVKTETIDDSVEEEPKKEQKKEKKEKFQKAPHSESYNTLATKIDPSKVYSLNEGLELLKSLQRGKFDETVELHINTASTGITGSITLPHGTGKKTRVAIATENLIAEVEKGKIDFDILVADPAMMPKLAKVAKVLGPRGLMPNPKAGTITSKPDEVVKKYEGGQLNFKTEAKNPIMHLTVGKMSFGTEKLAENIDAMISAIKRPNIIDITLKSTMSPGVKIQV
jgi:ribosomal protein L1